MVFRFYSKVDKIKFIRVPIHPYNLHTFRGIDGFLKCVCSYNSLDIILEIFTFSFNYQPFFSLSASQLDA